MTATPLPRLFGRHEECAVLDDVIASLRTGTSAVRVVRGEAGIGKSVLLEYAAAQASGMTVTRAQGVEADMELAWASLHQLCAPFIGAVDNLPTPQRNALQVAFGITAGDPPDRFLVGLAVLTLLTHASEDRPVLLAVDDAHWLDQVSLQTLEFVARRLLAEPVGILFTIRDPEGADALRGLPELALTGLDKQAAGAFLGSSVDGRIEPRVRDRLVAETHGNPLALIELSRGRAGAELAYGPDAADLGPVSTRIERDYARRLDELPDDSRTLLLLAAADPVGDLVLLTRAAEILGILPDLAPARSAGLVDVGESIRFRHPLARSAVYRAADAKTRRAAHRALAAATDPVRDPDRQAWHAAQGSDGPDAAIAAAVEQAADRARQRGGLAAEAVLLERSATLTPDPWLRGRRALAAAEAHFSAAAPDRAVQLGALADLCPLGPLDRARLGRLRARMLFGRSRSDDAAPLLLDAAARFAVEDSPLARETYLEAISATVFAGHLHGPHGARAAAIAARASGAPSSGSEGLDLLLDAVSTVLADGNDAGVPALAAALQPFAHEQLASRDATMRWLLSVPVAIESFIHHRWDLRAWDVLSSRAVRLARDLGALSVLPPALIYHGGVAIHHGDFAAAARMIDEADAIAAATGQAPHRYATLVLAAWRGDEREAAAPLAEARSSASDHGEVSLLGVTGYVQGVLYNGLARYADALAAAQVGVEHDGYNFTGLSLVEHVEAAFHCGELDLAQGSLDRLVELTDAADTGWARGIQARSRALLSTDARESDRLYRSAIDELTADQVTVEVARSHLIYGEWLRRVRRRSDAREHLRTAHQMFADMGSIAFAERSRRELAATGEEVRPRDVVNPARLTPQEAQIATLAAGGMTNARIGAELFLSPHTVEWHLRKVYAKLEIRSRRDLARALEALGLEAEGAGTAPV